MASSEPKKTGLAKGTKLKCIAYEKWYDLCSLYTEKYEGTLSQAKFLKSPLSSETFNMKHRVSFSRNLKKFKEGKLKRIPTFRTKASITKPEKTLLIITGASRGLGQSFATNFVKTQIIESFKSPKQNHTLRALLLARSREGLQETEYLMKQEFQKQITTNATGPSIATASINSNSKQKHNLMVTSHIIDLSNLETLEQNLQSIFSLVFNNDMVENGTDLKHDYEHSILVNNAGSIGHVGPLSAVSNLREMQQEIDFNVTSSLWVSTQFAKLSSSFHTQKSTIVNLSSLCALQPFPTMGLYCTGKAARDMFHETLAHEHNQDSQSPKKTKIKVLNYAPGACDTKMQTFLRTSPYLDKKLNESFHKMKSDETLVNPDDAAEKLVDLVWKGNFANGAHIDYWDLKQPALSESIEKSEEV